MTEPTLPTQKSIPLRLIETVPPTVGAMLAMKVLGQLKWDRQLFILTSECAAINFIVGLLIYKLRLYNYQSAIKSRMTR